MSKIFTQSFKLDQVEQDTVMRVAQRLGETKYHLIKRCFLIGFRIVVQQLKEQDDIDKGSLNNTEGSLFEPIIKPTDRPLHDPNHFFVKPKTPQNSWQ